MTFPTWNKPLIAAALTLGFASAVQALPINFESATPGTFISPASTYYEGGFAFEVWDDFATIDSAAAFGPGYGLDLAPPRGNDTQFVSVLNDSRLVMSRVDGAAFGLAGFDFGYISPLTGLFAPDESAGRLLATFVTSDGDFGEASWDFGQADGNGEFSFLTLGANEMGGLSAGITAIAFGACAYDGSGGCVFKSGGFSQFALDNLAVPEPGSLALAGLALAVGGALRRRNRVVA